LFGGALAAAIVENAPPAVRCTAVALGYNLYLGVKVNEKASSFPDWSGTDQKRDFAISGGLLTLTARALSTGGRADVTWKRAQ